MRRKWYLAPLLGLLLLIVLASPVMAEDGNNGTVTFGSDLVLQDGDRLHGDAVVFGANAYIEQGGILTGDLAVLGGSAVVSGQVAGSVVVFGGDAQIEGAAQVNGDVVSFGGNVLQDQEAMVGGQVFSGSTMGPFRLDEWSLPWYHVTPFTELQRASPTPQLWWETGVGGLFGLLRSVLGAILSAMLLAGLAILALLVIPRQTEQVIECVETAWPTSLGTGILVALGAVVASVLLIVTLCLAPIGLLALALLAIAWFLGTVSVGIIVGRRLFQNLPSVSSSPLVSAAVGTGMVALLSQTPCIGWLLGVAVGTIGLGAVVLTKAGTQPYRAAAPAAALPPAGEEGEDQ